MIPIKRHHHHHHSILLISILLILLLLLTTNDSTSLATTNNNEILIVDDNNNNRRILTTKKKTKSPTTPHVAPSSAPSTPKPTKIKPTKPTKKTSSPKSSSPTSGVPTITTTTKQPSSKKPTTTSKPTTSHPTLGVNETYAPTISNNPTKSPTTSTMTTTPTSHPSPMPTLSPFTLVSEQWGSDAECSSIRYVRPYQFPNQCEFNIDTDLYEVRTCSYLILNESTCVYEANTTNKIIPFNKCLTTPTSPPVIAAELNKTSSPTLSIHGYMLKCAEFDASSMDEFVQVEFYVDNVNCDGNSGTTTTIVQSELFQLGHCYQYSKWSRYLISEDDWATPLYITLTEFGLYAMPFTEEGCDFNTNTATPLLLSGDIQDIIGEQNVDFASICLPATQYVVTNNRRQLSSQQQQQQQAIGGFKFTSIKSILHPISDSPSTRPTSSPVLVTSEPTTTIPTTNSPTITITKSPSSLPSSPTYEPTRTDGNITVTDKDMKAWAALYDALQGKGWILCSGTQALPCTCSGVTCSIPLVFLGPLPGASITEIILPNNNMNGTFPSAVLNSFPKLSRLNIIGNPLVTPPSDATPCIYLKFCTINTKGILENCKVDSSIPLCEPTNTPTKQITMPPNPDTNFSTTSPTINNGAVPNSNQLSSGALAAAIIVPILVVLICVICIYIWWSKKKKQSQGNYNNNMYNGFNANTTAAAGGGGGGGATTSATRATSGGAGATSTAAAAAGNSTNTMNIGAIPSSPQRQRPTPTKPLPTTSVPTNMWLAPTVQQPGDDDRDMFGLQSPKLSPPHHQQQQQHQLSSNYSSSTGNSRPAPPIPTSSKPKVPGRPDPSEPPPPLKKNTSTSSQQQSQQQPQFDEEEDPFDEDIFVLKPQQQQQQQHNMQKFPSSNPFDDEATI
jgi:hypothetical protein